MAYKLLSDIGHYEFEAGRHSWTGSSVAVRSVSRNHLAPIAQLATNNGAQAFLTKSRASGDQVTMAIHKAIAAVDLKRAERHLMCANLPLAVSSSTR